MAASVSQRKVFCTGMGLDGGTYCSRGRASHGWVGDFGAERHCGRNARGACSEASATRLEKHWGRVVSRESLRIQFRRSLLCGHWKLGRQLCTSVKSRECFSVRVDVSFGAHTMTGMCRWTWRGVMVVSLCSSGEVDGMQL